MLCFYLCVYVLLISTDISRGESRTPPAGMILHKTSLSWEDADRKCQREGAVLASPISDKVLEAMKSLIGSKNTLYFTGIKADYFTGPFKSVEGVPLESMSLVVMDMIDTIDQLNGDCLAMNSNSIQAVPCYSRLPFMCYNAKDVNANKKKEYLKCGPVHEGYKYDESQRNCYKMHDMWSTWKQAEQTCVDEGGHLLIIDNKKEARTVMKMLKNSGWTWTWTGFSYRSGNWVTVLGDPVEDLFDTWWQGPKPNDSSFCGRFHDTVLGWWKCASTQPFICEKIPKNY